MRWIVQDSTEKPLSLLNKDTQDFYHYPASGLDNIYLDTGYTIETYDGETCISISNIDDLHEAICFRLATQREGLSPKEIRFFRATIGQTQSQLAKIFGVTDETVAHWEKGQTKIPIACDKLLRAIFFGKVFP